MGSRRVGINHPHHHGFGSCWQSTPCPPSSPGILDPGWHYFLPPSILSSAWAGRSGESGLQSDYTDTEERVLEITSGSRSTGQPHLNAQRLSRILPTPGKPSVGLEVRTHGGLGTESASLPTGLEGGRGSAQSLIVGVAGRCGVKGFERGSQCVYMFWSGRKDNSYPV